MDWLREMLKSLGVDEKRIEEIVSKAEDDKESEIAGLKQKNSELLGKLKRKDDGEAGKSVELEEQISELKEQLARVTKESEKTRKALEKERDDYKTLATNEQTAVSKLVLDNGLTEALTKAGVRKELLPAARALLKEQGILSVKSEGDIRKAVAKLVKDGKEEEIELNEYVEKHFISTDTGKAFLSPSGNSGAGGVVNSEGGSTTKKWADMNLRERTALHKANPVLAAELAKAN